MTLLTVRKNWKIISFGKWAELLYWVALQLYRDTLTFYSKANGLFRTKQCRFQSWCALECNIPVCLCVSQTPTLMAENRPTLISVKSSCSPRNWHHNAAETHSVFITCLSRYTHLPATEFTLKIFVAWQTLLLAHTYLSNYIFDWLPARSGYGLESGLWKALMSTIAEYTVNRLTKSVDFPPWKLCYTCIIERLSQLGIFLRWYIRGLVYLVLY